MDPVPDTHNAWFPESPPALHQCSQCWVRKLGVLESLDYREPNCSEDTLLLLGNPTGVTGAWQGPRRSFWMVEPLTPPDEPSLSRVGSSKQTNLSCLSDSPGSPGKYSCTAVRNWASGRRKRQEPKQITKSAVGLSPQKS